MKRSVERVQFGYWHPSMGGDVSPPGHQPDWVETEPPALSVGHVYQLTTKEPDLADETIPIEIEVPTRGTLTERLTSRKFLASIGVAIANLLAGKPEYAALAVAVWTLVEGYVDGKRA